MGRRSSYQTVTEIIIAFLERRVWSQVALARRLQIESRALRARLLELREAGMKLDREEDTPHVYWSVPRNWFPDASVLRVADRSLIARLLARLPDSRDRERALGVLLDTAAGSAPAQNHSETPTTPDVLTAIEDACAKKQAASIVYYSASRGDRGRRHVSPHRITYGEHPRFVATCHRTNTLKWFRLDRTEEARLDPNESFRDAANENIGEFLRRSIDGYGSGTPVEASFFVRWPEARWVIASLPPSLEAAVEHFRDGVRVATLTAANEVLARFVAGLGDLARAETPELRDRVTAIARGALTANGPGPVAATLRKQPVRAIRSSR